jgi:hypothetical protein
MRSFLSAPVVLVLVNNGGWCRQRWNQSRRAPPSKPPPWKPRDRIPQLDRRTLRQQVIEFLKSARQQRHDLRAAGAALLAM